MLFTQAGEVAETLRPHVSILLGLAQAHSNFAQFAVAAVREVATAGGAAGAEAVAHEVGQLIAIMQQHEQMPLEAGKAGRVLELLLEAPPALQVILQQQPKALGEQLMQLLAVLDTAGDGEDGGEGDVGMAASQALSDLMDTPEGRQAFLPLIPQLLGFVSEQHGDDAAYCALVIMHEIATGSPAGAHAVAQHVEDWLLPAVQSCLQLHRLQALVKACSTIAELLAADWEAAEAEPDQPGQQHHDHQQQPQQAMAAQAAPGGSAAAVAYGGAVVGGLGMRQEHAQVAVDALVETLLQDDDFGAALNAAITLWNFKHSLDNMAQLVAPRCTAAVVDLAGRIELHFSEPGADQNERIRHGWAAFECSFSVLGAAATVAAATQQELPSFVDPLAQMLECCRDRDKVAILSLTVLRLVAESRAGQLALVPLRGLVHAVFGSTTADDAEAVEATGEGRHVHPLLARLNDGVVLLKKQQQGMQAAVQEAAVALARAAAVHHEQPGAPKLQAEFLGHLQHFERCFARNQRMLQQLQRAEVCPEYLM